MDRFALYMAQRAAHDGVLTTLFIVGVFAALVWRVLDEFPSPTRAKQIALVAVALVLYGSLLPF